MSHDEFEQAYREEERRARIANSKLGAILAIILMPLGSFLDYAVYPELFTDFLKLRLISAVLVGAVYGLFFTRIGLRFDRLLGMAWYLIPAVFITLMIYQSGDPTSPYYAGLNIVLLGVGLILPWTYKENLASALLIMAMYLGASLALEPEGTAPAESSASGSVAENAPLSVARDDPLREAATGFGLLFNNLYFLALTGLIVVVGSYSHNRMRYREFSLRYELDENRKTVEETNRRLVELDRMKNRFFANVSHELRTPLTLLLTPLESLLHRRRQALDPEAREWLQTMHANGMRLLKLINDLLDLVRLDSGRMKVKREPLEVEAFLKGLLQSIRKTADDRGVRLRSRLDLPVAQVLVDRDKLEKILLNLTFNALKFTPRGGEVTVAIEEAAPNWLACHVSDTGMGISQENLDRIFDRFWQADSSSQRKHQGTGIGLALVRELAEAQEGEVHVASEWGQGSRFTVKVPYERLTRPATGRQDPDPTDPGVEPGEITPEEPDDWLANLYRRAELSPAMSSVRPSLSPSRARPSGDAPSVLIAEDEPDMLRFLQSQLGAQFEILEAVDGRQAVEEAGRCLPDLILLDMMMPEKDGLEVCRELRERPPTREIPIVLLTARADDQTKLAGLEAGANDFLSKPFSTAELRLRVANLVTSHQLKRRLARKNEALEAAMEQLKATEAQLVHSEKLASLGRMSAGIIHEINNPLNYSKTGLHTLKGFAKQLPQSEQGDYEDLLGDVQDGLDRVQTIVSDLRRFTHPQVTGFEFVRIDPLIEAALRFLSHRWRDQVRVERHIPEAFEVRAHSNHLIQVLINLVQNALDALKTKDFEGEEPTIRIEGWYEAGHPRLTIRDNGPGIPSDDLNRIFDPFFTSKDVGQGMGLGLSICYRIMEDHHGRIRVNTEPGRFTEFILEFPGLDRQNETA